MLPTPGELAAMNETSRLNIIFDIDQTLIFGLEREDFPQNS